MLSRSARRSVFFWVLVMSSVLTLGLAVWSWVRQRQQVALQAHPVSVSPHAAPDFGLPSLERTFVRRDDLSGQVVLLTFWATWCQPCRAELPVLDAIQRAYATSQRFTVIGINLEENSAVVQGFAQELHLTFPILLDADGHVTRDSYNVRTLPMSFIIDRDGRIRDQWVGAISREAMLSRLERVW